MKSNINTLLFDSYLVFNQDQIHQFGFSASHCMWSWKRQGLSGYTKEEPLPNVAYQNYVFFSLHLHCMMVSILFQT